MSKNSKFIICIRLVFAVYVLCVLALTLLDRSPSSIPFKDYVVRFSEFVPFKIFAEYAEMIRLDILTVWDVIYQIAGNLFLFFPFGVLFPASFPKIREAKKCLPIALSSIFVIELSQLLLKMGSFDITDVMLNMLGAVLGYLLYRLAEKSFAQRQSKPD